VTIHANNEQPSLEHVILFLEKAAVVFRYTQHFTNSTITNQPEYQPKYKGETQYATKLKQPRKTTAAKTNGTSPQKSISRYGNCAVFSKSGKDQFFINFYHKYSILSENFSYLLK
jgi:hypothetical protein